MTEQIRLICNHCTTSNYCGIDYYGIDSDILILKNKNCPVCKKGIMVEQFTKQEQLIVRACKSLNPVKRLASYYLHFYLNDTDQLPYMSHILTEFLVKYELQFKPDLAKILDGINPANIEWNYGREETTPYWERTVRTLINQIRFVKRDILKEMGFIIPARFRDY